MTEFAFVKELTPGTIGIYSLLAVVLVALIKAWPVLALQAIDARAKLRQEKRDELTDCQRRLDEMAQRLDEAEASMHGFELKLLGAISSYRILDIEVETNLPDSSALAQARAVMSAAFALSPSTEAPPRG